MKRFKICGKKRFVWKIEDFKSVLFTLVKGFIEVQLSKGL